MFKNVAFFLSCIGKLFIGKIETPSVPVVAGAQLDRVTKIPLDVSVPASAVRHCVFF